MIISAFEVVSAVEGKLLQGSGEQTFSSVATDTRQLHTGALFFALQGENRDGHDFIPDAEGRGAAGAVVKCLPKGMQTALALVQVVDPLTALGRLAAWWRRKFPVPCIAITGSSGKSTTKEMAAKILEDRFPVLANEENFNTEIGVPLTLFRLNSDHRALVQELGMRGRGQIALLASLIEPKVGVITNVGTAHVGILGSREAILEAKLELSRCLAPGGTLVVAGDDPTLRKRAMEGAAAVVTFGLKSHNDLHATDVVPDGPAMRFNMHFATETAQVRLPLAGTHNVLNALAATAATIQLGVGLAEAAASLGALRPLRMRCQPIQTAAGITILNDSYNANPESTQAALQMLSLWPAEGERIAVLGDMLELGDYAREAHSRIGAEAARLGVNLIVAVGEFAQAVVEGARKTEGYQGKAHLCRTKQEAKKFLLRQVRPGAAVLVKGSRMTGMEEMVEALQSEFSNAGPSKPGSLQPLKPSPGR